MEITLQFPPWIMCMNIFLQIKNPTNNWNNKKVQEWDEVFTLLNISAKCSQACWIKEAGRVHLKKSLTSQWMLVKGNWTHTEPLQWGSDSSAWGEENPKGVGWGGKRPIRGGIKGRRPSRKIIIDFILIDTDYPPIGYAIQRRGRWEMKREWKKSVKNRKEYIWKYIVKTYDKIRKIYVKWVLLETPCIISIQIIVLF